MDWTCSSTSALTIANGISATAGQEGLGGPAVGEQESWEQAGILLLCSAEPYSMSRAWAFPFTSAHSLNLTSIPAGAGSWRQKNLTRVLSSSVWAPHMKGKDFEGLNSLDLTQVWVLRQPFLLIWEKSQAFLISQKPWNPRG